MLAEREKMISANGDKWKKQAYDGEALEAFKASSHYNVLEELIFKEIEKGAFNTLKNPDLDMTDLNQLYQLRALCQTIDIIRKSIDAQIVAAKNARLFLKEANSTQEGEHE